MREYTGCNVIQERWDGMEERGRDVSPKAPTAPPLTEPLNFK